MIDDLFQPLGAEAYVHIRDIDGDRSFGVRDTAPVVLVSVMKLFVAWEFRRQVEEGLIDPAATVRVTAADRLGGTGTAGFRHDAQVSLGDLTALMLEVSDSTAADLVVKQIGTAALRGLPSRLGLPNTRLIGSPRAILEEVARDLDVDGPDGLGHVLATGAVTTEELRRTSAWDPARTNASTPADMTRFLRDVWNGPPGIAGALRTWMGRQLTGGRLTRLAPSGVKVYGRSGSLPGWLNEVAVLEWPDGRRHAIAVFVRTSRPNFREIELAMARAGMYLAERLGGSSVDLGPGAGRVDGVVGDGTLNEDAHTAVTLEQLW